MNKIDRGAARRAPNSPKQDLRAWLAQMEAAGEVNRVSGANREEEIGGIVDFHQRTRSISLASAAFPSVRLIRLIEVRILASTRCPRG